MTRRVFLIIAAAAVVLAVLLWLFFGPGRPSVSRTVAPVDASTMGEAAACKRTSVSIR